MDWTRQIRGEFTRLGKHPDDSVVDELAQHASAAFEATLADGASWADAESRTRALIESWCAGTGGPRRIERAPLLQSAPATRSALAGLGLDIRNAFRLVQRQTSFAVACIVMIALGVGATTTIFSALKPLVFEPLPYADGDRIAMIWETRGGGPRADGTFGMYQWLLERNRSLESIAVFKPWQPTLSGSDTPERLQGQRVSVAYFPVLGVAPALGRGFVASDDRPGAPNVVILSDAVWRRRFQGDRTILGQTIIIDSTPSVVVGVMPHGFENVLAPTAEIWAPLQYAMSQGRAWGHHLRTVARLRPDVSIARASEEMDALGQAAIQELHPQTYGRDLKMMAVGLGEDVTRSVRPALFAIATAVGLVLVIACVNVICLLLARGARRQAEFALRAALGAGRTRLMRQLVTECVVLAVAGGALGWVIAQSSLRTIVALGATSLHRAEAIQIDSKVFAFAVAVTAIVGLVIGLIPGMQAAKSDQLGLLRGSWRLAGGHHRLRRSLVVVEVALSLVLLVCSGLLVRSLQQWFAIPAGFDSSRVLSMRVESIGLRLDNTDGVAAHWQDILDAVRHVPGVQTAALTNQLPLSGDRDEYGVHFEESSDQCCNSFRYAVSPGYFETLRLPVRDGRVLGDNDRAGAPLAAVISASLARHRFDQASALGKRLRIGPADGPLFTVVGVVGDLKQVSLALDEADAVYTTTSQTPVPERMTSLLVRTTGDPLALAEPVRRAVLSVDRNQLVSRVSTLDALVADSAADRRFALLLFGVFAVTALVLATAGLYSVLAGSVAERTREIGVRSALGASPRAIVGSVILQGASLAGFGIAVGLVLSVAASGLLTTLLFRVSRIDPAAYVAVVALLMAIAVLASVLPAWRAARVDPVKALRSE